MNAEQPYPRLWRAQLDSTHCGLPLPELTIYVEAGSEYEAHVRIAAVVAASEGEKLNDVWDRIRDVRSGARLLEEGVSVDRVMRLFEVGSDAGRPIYCEHPLFLTIAPGELCRLWAACQTQDAG